MTYSIAQICTFSLLSCFAFLEAAAQSVMMNKEVLRALAGTIYAVPSNQTREGELESCGFDFQAVAFDHVYNKGEPFILNGNFSFRKSGDSNFAIAYKVGTFIVENGALTPKAPNLVWIKLGPTLIKPDRILNAETPGYGLYVSSFTPQVAKGLEEIVNQRKISVGFNRLKDGLDLVVPVDLNVRETNADTGKTKQKKDLALGREFAECLTKILAK